MTNERDDMTLTAYAAGELDERRRRAVEARLASDSRAKAQVGVIRKVIALLIRAFQGESAPRLAAAQRAAIEAGSSGQPRRWWLLAAGLAAAAAILVAGLFMFGLGGADESDRGQVVKTAPNVRGDETNHKANTPAPIGTPPLSRPAPNVPDGEANRKAKTPAPVETPPTSKTAPAAAKGMVRLKIALPNPGIIGTPEPIRNEPNMGPARKGKRPPFLAPKGTVNLALGKPVKSSDLEPIIGELKLITDGDKETGQGYFVELAPGKQWVVIDLQQEAAIYAIVVWHHHGRIVAYRDVVVQVSADPDFIDYRTVYNNDHDNSSGQGKGRQKVYMEDLQGKLIDCKGVRGRYVRLWSKENTSNEANHYIEVEVYGKPVAGE